MRRRRLAIERAATRLEAAAAELEAKREVASHALAERDKAGEAYLAEYTKYTRLLREAKKAGIPVASVARWSGFLEPTVWRIMRSGHVPRLRPGISTLVRRHYPPSD